MNGQKSSSQNKKGKRKASKQRAQTQIIIQESGSSQTRGKARAQAAKSNPRMPQLSVYDKRLIEQIVNTEGCQGGSATVTPSPLPARGHAAHVKLEHVVDNVPDQTTICVKPNLWPVSITSEAPMLMLGASLVGENDGTNVTGLLYQGESTNGVWSYNYQIHSEDLYAKYGFSIDCPAGGILAVSTMGWPSGTYEMWFHNSDTDEWDTMGTFLGQDTAGGSNVQNFEAVSNVDAFSIESVNAQMGLIESFINFGTGKAIHTGPATSVHYPVSVDIPPGYERFRITALSVKVTFFGSTLNNQGAIAIARTYPGWTPFDDDAVAPFDAIAGLPFQTYNGRMEDGAHGWWLPATVEELDFRNSNNLADELDQTRIWIAMTGLAADEPVRIQVDAVVEFYNPQPYYQKVACPYFSDKYGHLFYELGLITCVGDNPGHFARAIGIGKTVAKGLNTALNVASSIAPLFG